MKNLIDFFVAVGLLLPLFLGLAIGLMQCLQPKPPTTNTSFIRLLIGELGLEVIPETPELWQSVDSASYDLILRQEARKQGVET